MVLYICMDKETLQKDIENKTKELATLKSNILSETEEVKKQDLEDQQKKAEEELKVLNDKLDELQKIENTTSTDEVKKETTQLKNEVEITSDWTYELIKGSVMENKLKEIGKSDVEIKEFAEKIDKVVRKFLDQELVWFSNSIKNSMSVGIQFAMMETLTQQWATWAAEFFTAFSGTNTESWTSAFEWLYKAFGKLWGVNHFFILANKVQNLTWFLADKKSSITASDNIPELMNPAKFKALLSKPVWSNQVQIDKLDITKVLTLDATASNEMSDKEKADLQKIVNNPNIPITKETIASIDKSLLTADKLLETRGNIKSKASDLVDKIASVLNIDIPFFGNLGEMIGMEFPTDLLGEKKDGGILNFVLGVLWFRGGVKWLHREYIREKLDDLDIDNEFIKKSYADFQKNNTDATITNDSDTSTWKVCWLSAPSAKEAEVKAKIPANYGVLKKSIIDNLGTTIFNPVMVAKFAPELIIIEDTTKKDSGVVDVSKIKGNEDAFVDTYLKYIIPLLADTDDDFISSKKVDKDSFALAVMGGLVGDKYFIEWVNIWLVSTMDFKATALEITPVVESSMNIINGKIDFSKWNFTAEQRGNINLLIDEMNKAKIINPYTQVGILSVIGKESGFIPKNETSYANTKDNVRIREIFTDRVPASDDELNILKTNDEAFFDAVYGPAAAAKADRNTGNTEPGDGYKYRGRGFNGLTFKTNYKTYGDMIGEDLVTHPDRVNDPLIAAKIAVQFFLAWQDSSPIPQFTTKEDAAIYFANKNAGWGTGTNKHTDNAVAASRNFEVQAA